jgi:phage terminase large subunit
VAREEQPIVATPIILNPGAQEDFVHNDFLYSAYIGGLGSGKTFGGLARALKFATQPRRSGDVYGPRGTVAAATYPHLRDTVFPMMEQLVNQTGAAVWSRDFRKSEKKLELPGNKGIILFRSLDEPDKVVRGPELSWVYIDEGRNVDMYSWKLVIGRLRQPGYRWGAWVASTPNGRDWMWRVFHPDSEDHWENSEWFNAPTMENAHLPQEYVDALGAAYHGRFYQQEVLGQFVGAIEGAVFPFYDPVHHVQDIQYDPKLPLYSFWDFGYGDTGVVIFAQVEWRKVETGRPGRPVKLPYLYVLDAVDHKEWAAKDWAAAYHGMLGEVFGGVKTTGDFGDPAGAQRSVAGGTSVIGDLNAQGVPVVPVAKRPQDYAIRILNNMIAGGRVIIAESCNPRMSDALEQHHWNIDRDGTKVGATPVHDWSSHWVDALRYGASAVLSFYARPADEPDQQSYTPDQYGYVFEQLTKPKDARWGGRSRRHITFMPRAAAPAEETHGS